MQHTYNNKQFCQCITTVRDEYMTIFDDVVVDYWYCSVVVYQILPPRIIHHDGALGNNTTPVGIDNAHWLVQYVRIQQSTTGIDTQSTKVFLQKELDCVNRIMCAPTNSINIHNNRREITYNNNGGVYGEGWSFTVSADRVGVLGYIYKPNIAINWLVCTMWNSERVWGMKWQQLLCVAV